MKGELQEKMSERAFVEQELASLIEVTQKLESELDSVLQNQN